jgi:ESSS subunit of NADH:ubiquinone oxidoreductase (complex I)
MFSAAVARSTVARRVATTTAKSSASHPRPGGTGVLQRQQQQQHQRRMGSDMPVPQSQNAPLWHGHSVKKEGWEEYMYFYYAAGIVLQAAVLLATPETSIESWARAEAKARLYLASSSKGGQTEFEFGKHYQDVVEAENLELWSQFAAKAVTPGDDDDDDEDEEEEEEVRICKHVLLYLVR